MSKKKAIAEDSNNENMIVRTTSLTMHIVKEYIRPGDVVVDCTMGNGYDTLSLARAVGCVGKNGQPGSLRGRVYSFDIQPEALVMTRSLLSENGVENPEESGINMILASHEKTDEYLAGEEGSISAFVFNLGFMPGQNKNIFTTAETSLSAIKKAIKFVRTNGVVSVTTYRGHEEGEREYEAIIAFLQTLPSKKYHVASVNMINQKKTAPSLFLITPKKDDRADF